MAFKILYSDTHAVAETLREISSKYRAYKKFCDMGCGTVYRSMQFQGFGRKLHGIDLHDCRLPEYKTKEFKFIKGDFFKTGLPAKSFDLILNFDVIEHLEKPELLLQEIYRVLIPGGICVLATPNRYRILNSIMLLLGKRKYPYCISSVYDDYPEYWHITEFTDGQIRKLANKNNFKVIEHYKVYYGWPGRIGFKKLFGLPFYHNHIHILKKS